jgi:hypothetical protein
LIGGAAAGPSAPLPVAGSLVPAGGTVRSVKSSLISLDRGIGRNRLELEEAP